VVKDGAEYSSVGLPDEIAQRLRFTTLTVTASKAQKHHSGKKKITPSEQVCTQKEFDGGRQNITQSTCAIDENITLVFMLLHTGFSCDD